MRPMTREQIVSTLRRWFEAHPAGILAAWLFGSVARGQEHGASDVDVGIVLDHRRPLSLDDLDRCAGVQDELSALLGRDVDLVPLNGASLDLVHRMLADGVLLFESDRERRLEFEVLAQGEYFDFAPYLEQYRRDVLRRA